MLDNIVEFIMLGTIIKPNKRNKQQF